MQTIPVSCTSCGHAMKFAPDKAGRKAKCPKCQNILTIPKTDQANGPAAAPGAAPAPVEDEGDGMYEVVHDKDLEERRQRLEEEDRLRQKELKKKKAPKLKKKFKSLPEAELWEKVHFGMLFLFLGTCVWAFTHLLQGMWVGLGSVEFADHARMTTELIERQMDARAERGEPRIADDGRFWEFSQYHYLVALAAGRGFVTFAKFCLIVNLILYPIQAILWFVGFILCIPVPRHHGTLGLLIAIMALGGVNFLFFLFFRVLPTTGLYRYYLIPYFLPEILFTEYNMERVYPIFMLWSASPFWESLLSIFLQFVWYLQPILMAVFVWNCARVLKADRLEEQAGGVAANGFAQLFLWLALLMISVCGTTPVLVAVLRVLYVLWYSALMMFIVRSALLVWSCRDALDARLNPEG